MGLFSQKERIPDPQISIHLDRAGSNSTFYPGSSIRGTASIETDVPRQLLSARICLFGRITTHSVRKKTHHNAGGVASVNNTRTVYIKYHDEAELFQVDQALLEHASLEPGRRADCRFALTFPAWSGAIVGDVPYTRETARTETYANATHPLPPSFSYRQSQDSYAIVEYRLRVVVYFGERLEPFIHNANQPLVFCPHQAAHQSGFVEFVRPPQNYTSSRLSGEQKSIGHSVRDRFSSRTPSIIVVMKASVPVSVPVAAAFTVHTCVEIEGMSHPSIYIPSVDLTIKSLKLIPITAWRALKVERSGHFFGDSPEHEVIREETVRLNALAGTITAGQQQLENGNKLMFPASFEARIPGSICPTFRTLNIIRSYMVQMTLAAEISGKAFEHKLESRIEVLSSLPATM